MVKERIIAALRIVGPLTKQELLDLIKCLKEVHLEHVEPALEELKAHGHIHEVRGKLHLKDHLI